MQLVLDVGRLSRQRPQGRKDSDRYNPRDQQRGHYEMPDEWMPRSSLIVSTKGSFPSFKTWRLQTEEAGMPATLKAHGIGV